MPDVNLHWYRDACSVIHHPLALVDTDHHFIWVNAAFERLLGYSAGELQEKTWMSIMVREDVGNYLTAVESVIDGETASYTSASRYRNKGGSVVTAITTAWRFPAGEGAMAGFTVEAIPRTTVQEMTEFNERHAQDIKALADRLQKLEWHREVWNTVATVILRWLPLIAACATGIAWLIQQIVT